MILELLTHFSLPLNVFIGFLNSLEFLLCSFLIFFSHLCYFIRAVAKGHFSVCFFDFCIVRIFCGSKYLVIAFSISVAHVLTACKVHVWSPHHCSNAL